MSPKCRLAIIMVLLMIVPPALSTGNGNTDPAGARAGPRAYDPWWDYGWNFRMPITIDNTANPGGLGNYQLMMNISYDNDMRTDFADLRFVQYNQTLGQNIALQYWLENKADGAYAVVWVNVSEIRAGETSTVYMYYGNPSTGSASNGENTFDLYDDFGNYSDGTSIPNWQEVAGDWILTTPPGKTRAVRLDDTTSSSALIRSATYGGARIIEADLADELFSNNNPHPGIVIGYQDANNYNAVYWRSNTVELVRWQVSGGTETGTTICGGLAGGVASTYHRMRVSVDASGNVVNINFLSYNTAPGFSVQTTGAGLWQHRSMADIGWCDNFRVRKYAAVEPRYSFGPEELPFKFKSMTYGPQRMNDRESVFFNATFNNPTPDIIRIALAARESDVFNATSDYFFSEDVNLAPSADTTVPFCWTAAGGPRTIWLAVFGYPLASVKIKVNRDPVLAPVKDQSLVQDREFLLQLNASDPDGDTLYWYIDNPLLNMTNLSNRSAQISFLPTNDDIGVHRANITVKDPMNRTASIRMNFTVNNVNDPPTLEKIPSLSATQYKELRYKVNATDPDSKWGDVLRYGDNTDLFDIDERTGVFFFTPTEEHVGKHNVKVTVTDMEGASETSSFTITVANVNDPPTLEIIPPQFTLQGRAFQLKVAASDPDLKSDPTEKLRFTDDCPLFSINNDTGMISFTPSNDDLGVWRANISVTDRGGLSNTTPLAITVMNANDPPTMDAIPAQTATEEQLFEYQCVAADPDMKWGLDNLTFSDDTDLFNIDPKTGAIAFTPTGAQVGSRRVTITVKDERGAQASASFDIAVVHVNHPPYEVAIRFPLDGARLKEGDQMWLDGTAKDNDRSDTLRYSWLDNGNPAGSGKNISVKLSPGKHTIILEVTDGTETIRSEVSVEVTKKEVITVAGSGDWTMMAGAAIAVVAVLAILGVLATRRRSKPAREEPSDGSRVSSIPEGDTVALPPVPPAEAAGQEQGAGEEAKRMIDAAVDRLSDYQEAHPDIVPEVAPVMENMEIARGFLGSGEYNDALAFAKEVDAAVNRMTQPAAPKRVAVRKKKAIAGKEACPGCGEELRPEWPTCPACGQTR